jgi:hypothetical protein
LALDFKIEANTLTKTEFLNMSRTETTLSDIEKLRTRLQVFNPYDPKI